MVERTEKVVFRNAEGEELAGRLELPAGEPRARAVFAHCFTCSKDIAAASRISRALRAKGIAVLRFDFTGLGNSEGDFANTNFSSNVDDLVHAGEWMREHLGGTDLLIGHSLGGAAVLAAAGRLPEVKAVATLGAPADPGHVSHLFEGAIDDIRERGSATVALAGRRFEIKRQFLEDLEQDGFKKHITELNRPLLILHSPTDEVVDVDNARRIYEAARHPKSFVSLDGADHLLSRAEDSEYVAETLAAWASRYLPRSTEPAAEEALPQGEVLVRSQAGAKFLQEVRAGRHRLLADEPQSFGGEDAGLAPYDFLLTALGTCTSMTLQMYARHKGLDLQSVAVRLRHAKVHAKDCEECEGNDDARVDRIEREITLEGDLTEAERARLIEIADRCPVHRTLEGEPVVVTKLA